MGKILCIMVLLSFLISGCSNQKSVQEQTTNQEITSQQFEENTAIDENKSTESRLEDKSIKNTLVEIDNWLIGDVWNDGYCDFYHYEEEGKSSLGESIDIEFSWEKFQENYKKKDKYDSFINSLPEEYNKIKELWGKLMGESEKLYSYYENGIEQTGTSADTAIFVQYREAFSDEVNSLVFESKEIKEDIKVEKGENIVIDVPADYISIQTQEELDEACKEAGYTAKLNEDGSATYTMTNKQHEEMMNNMKISINEAIEEMVSSGNYPNVTKIDANENFTLFTVTTKSKELDQTESFMILSFYAYGGIYNAFNGTDADNVHVDFINSDSQDIIFSSDSNNQ